MSKKPVAIISGTTRKGGIRGVTVSGYKCFGRPQHVAFAPLTILAGANSSGKSSVMQPLLLLKQTLEAPFDPGPLLLDGPNVKITSADQLLCQRVGGKHAKSFWLDVDWSVDAGLRLEFTDRNRGGFRLTSMTGRVEDHAVKYYVGMPQNRIRSVLGDHNVSIEKAVLRLVELEGPGKWRVNRERCFLSLQYWRGNRLIFQTGILPAQAIERELPRLIHLPGLRGSPERTYKTTSVGDSFPGTFQEYTASVVHRWQGTDPDKLWTACKALEMMGLTWQVEAVRLDDVRVELRVARLPSSDGAIKRDLVSIADVGLGVSQTLPVVVALTAAEPGQIVYLEQPEIHLHPRAQLGLAKVLADAAIRRITVIVETHSALLLRELQTLVASGQLPAGATKLHWFTRNATTGYTTVQSANLDQNGAFGESWPIDFGKITLDAESRYLDAVAGISHSR